MTFDQPPQVGISAIQSGIFASVAAALVARDPKFLEPVDVIVEAGSCFWPAVA